MTKIAFWKKVHENIEEGRVECPHHPCCVDILCGVCPYLDRDSLCELYNIIKNKHKTLVFAKNFIEAHEQKKGKNKGKKKSKVDKSTPDHISQENTFLKVAKTIRDRGYYCSNIQCYDCPLIGSEMGCGCGDHTATDEERAFRKRLIDNYISNNEPVNTTNKCEYVRYDFTDFGDAKSIFEPAKKPVEENIEKQVRCIDAKCFDFLTVGRIYLVYSTEGDYITIKDNRGIACSFLAEMFEPVEPRRKLVKCINNGLFDFYLTIGKIYEVLEESTEYFYIYGDSGDKLGFYKNQFEPAEKPVEPVPAFEPLPEPIRFEDEDKPVTVFIVTQFGIKKKDTTGYRRTIKSSDGTHRDQAIFPSGVRYAMENCYRTFDEAIIVAKMKWGF